MPVFRDFFKPKSASVFLFLHPVQKLHIDLAQNLSAPPSKVAQNRQGRFAVDFEYEFKAGTSVKRSGYGTLGQSQITSLGNIKGFLIAGKPIIVYSAVSMGGDSGASIIDVETGKIIGVHNAGTTDEAYGILISGQDRFKQQIEACIKSEIGP